MGRVHFPGARIQAHKVYVLWGGERITLDSMLEFQHFLTLIARLEDPALRKLVRYTEKESEAGTEMEVEPSLQQGPISELKVHPSFPLVVNGIDVGTMSIDFQFLLPTGQLVLQDVKGGGGKSANGRDTNKARMTRDSYARWRLGSALHGLPVYEVNIPGQHGRLVAGKCVDHTGHGEGSLCAYNARWGCGVTRKKSRKG